MINIPLKNINLKRNGVFLSISQHPPHSSLGGGDIQIRKTMHWQNMLIKNMGQPFLSHVGCSSSLGTRIPLIEIIKDDMSLVWYTCRLTRHSTYKNYVVFEHGVYFHFLCNIGICHVNTSSWLKLCSQISWLVLSISLSI